jgi:hypothetical protein
VSRWNARVKTFPSRGKTSEAETETPQDIMGFDCHCGDLQWLS